MKKMLRLALMLALVLALFVSNASAVLVYRQSDGNASTFETLEEAIVNGPVYMMNLYATQLPTAPVSPFGATDPNNPTPRTYISDPCMANYPAGTTYVYRSKDMYSSMSAAYRMNTNILVYTDAAFASKDEAFAYLQSLNLIDIIDEARGSVVLVTPTNPENGFGSADQYAFYQLQSAMCNLGYSVRGGDTSTYYAENSYFGGLTYRYVIGINGGATFVNNYVSNTFDYVSRIAGMLLINGSMQRVRDVAWTVPAYLVNPTETALDKYLIANDTDASVRQGDTMLYYNQINGLQKVYDKEDTALDTANLASLGTLVKDVYYNMFIKAMRVPVLEKALYTASTLYSNYNWNAAPYSLSERNAILPSDTQPAIGANKTGIGATADGIYVYEAVDADPEIMAVTTVPDEKGNTEYIRTWYEFLPAEVLDGSAANGSIPLILAYHGFGDDPVQAVDELGLLTLAGDERIAMIAPMHTAAHETLFETGAMMAKYMLATYPALDASRVYVTGYSYGGSATTRTVYGDASVFAAAVNMSGSPYTFASDEVKAQQSAQFETIDIPLMLCTSTLDSATHFDTKNGYIAVDFQDNITNFLKFNEMAPVTFDFATYPMSGVAGDIYTEDTIFNEYPRYNWKFLNEKGWPMVVLNVTEFLPHGLYPAFGQQAWDFMKSFSRNPETLEISYNPYVK